MIWIWFTMREMHATREKIPDTQATAFATWAPMAAPSEGCFRLTGLLTAAHLRDLGLELQDDRRRPHRAHRHSRDPTDRAGVRAPGAAVAIPAVGFVIRPLASDRQREELAGHHEADEGAQDAAAVADLVLDPVGVGHEGFVRRARLIEGPAFLGGAFHQLVLLEIDAFRKPDGKMSTGQHRGGQKPKSDAHSDDHRAGRQQKRYAADAHAAGLRLLLDRRLMQMVEGAGILAKPALDALGR